MSTHYTIDDLNDLADSIATDLATEYQIEPERDNGAIFQAACNADIEGGDPETLMRAAAEKVARDLAVES
ncbi:MAG: hypothetical protein ACO3LT_07580 [Ilumatobacteraceae bacterium]